MTRHDYKQNAYYMLYLIRCVLHNTVPAKEKLDKMDLAQLLKVAEDHSLSAMVAYALGSAGIKDKAFEDAKNKAVFRSVLFDNERRNILIELEKQKIWYLPLKGSIIKDYYPQIGMREMCDVDILFDNKAVEEVKNIMSANGYTMEHDDTGHDLVFMKEPCYNFEMHSALFNNAYRPVIDRYYESVRSMLVKDDDNNYGFHLTTEDLYVYITAHEYEHYILKGTGIRNLVDRYIILERFRSTLNEAHIDNELKKIELDDYEKSSRELLLKVFSGKTLSPAEKEMLDYYIFSGTYGNMENQVDNKFIEIGAGRSSLIKYILSRFSVPVTESDPRYKPYKKQFPLFYRYKVLLPLLPFYRLLKGILDRPRALWVEVKAIISRKKRT